MRGGRKQAKPDCGRPLDGRVRALRVDDHEHGPLFCVDNEHNATCFLEEAHSIAGHGDGFLLKTLERTRSSQTIN